MITFDHLKLARRNHSELKRIRDFLQSSHEGDDFSISHQPNRKCCQIEPWDQTAQFIKQFIQTKQPEPPFINALRW